jgi:hypothetical protein
MTTEIFNIISATIQILTLAVLIWTVNTAMKQFRAARKSTWAQSFYNCLTLIQDPKVIEARGIVFAIGEKRVALSELTKEEIESIKLVSRTYDAVGMMAQWGMIPQEIIVDSWCDSIRRLWPICEPYILAERSSRKAKEFWDDFQWLYTQAENFDQDRVNRVKRVRSLQALA